ncbi:MAG: ComF family protein [Bauldia sp.]|nr:ComF family protein [Bauldia sp.]
MGEIDEAAIARDRVRPLAAAGGVLRGLGRGVVRLAIPAHCLACERPVATDGTLCPDCWGLLRLIEQPFCDRLAIPFAYEPGDGALSPEAIADPPPFARMRAVAIYGPVARQLVHGLKYRDHLDLARWMGGWMARAGGDLLATADLVVPVPLHRARLWWRRFNQSAALAAEIARASGAAFAPTVLSRPRSTRRQVGLSATERRVNVRGAFRVVEEVKPLIAGRRVVLVDDVYTTGATAKAATRALLRAGAACVDLLVFARVARGES